MKTFLSYLAVAALILASSFTVSQQQHLNQESNGNCFGSIHAQREGKAAVTLNWTVSSADITRFIIERSYDGRAFESIASVSHKGLSDYTCIDKCRYSGRLHYRITALKQDGSTEISALEVAGNSH